MISWFGEFLSVDAAQPQQLDVLVPAWIYGWEASTWFSAGSLHLGSLSYAIWMACDGKIASFRELVWTESPQNPRNPHFLEKNHVVSPWFPMVSLSPFESCQRCPCHPYCDGWISRICPRWGADVRQMGKFERPHVASWLESWSMVFILGKSS